MNVHVSVLQEEEIKIGLESEIIKVETPGDYIPVPSIAEVGQTIVVKAVDDKGKPTEWKAVDMPSGGGASVELDTTLTQIGKAADAKAVGDALADKQPKGDYLTQNELPDMTAYRTAEAQDVIDAGKQDTLIQSGATVGQIAKITAVDENGKPTEWKAVDMASGVGDNWKLLVDFESTEEIAANTGMVFDTADDGTPINAKGIIIDWYCPAAAQGAYATFKVNNVQCTGYAQSTPAYYFWSGNLISTNAKAATLYFRPLTDVCLLTSDTNASLVPVWFAKTGAFETITSLQLTMFGGTYPVGLKIKILGR